MHWINVVKWQHMATHTAIGFLLSCLATFLFEQLTSSLYNLAAGAGVMTEHPSPSYELTRKWRKMQKKKNSVSPHNIRQKLGQLCPLPIFSQVKCFCASSPVDYLYVVFFSTEWDLRLDQVAITCWWWKIYRECIWNVFQWNYITYCTYFRCIYISTEYQRVPWFWILSVT